MTDLIERIRVKVAEEVPPEIAPLDRIIDGLAPGERETVDAVSARR